MVVDQMARASGAGFRQEKAWKAEVARADGLHLLKPLTYMNLSGESVRSAGQFYKIEAGDMLVVLDDLALPLGSLRFRAGGGSGGHRGLESVLDCLGTREVPRLRVGIGAPAGRGDADVVGHVLGGFSPEESQRLPELLKTACEAVDCACKRGLTAAMNQYN